MKAPSSEILHAVVVVAILACYTVLTTLNHDGTALLGALAGYLGGASVQKVTGSSSGG